MTGSGTWQTIDGGVMVFVPDENGASSSQHASPVDNLMARMSISCEPQSHANERSNRRSSQSIRQPLALVPLNTVPHDRADSPSTICDDGTGFQYTPTSSAPEPHEDLFTQLIHASGSNGDQALNTPDSPASSSTTSGYASDRTDFLFEELNTPCPKRNMVASHQGDISSLVAESLQQNPMRQLDFRRTTIRRPPRQSQRAPEYTVRHQWTNKQRYDLAILSRFFKADAEILSKVFNHMHNLNLDARKQVKPQEKFLRDNVDAFTFCLKIYNCPISDPNDEFSSDKAAVEEAARSIGIELERREVESNQSSGSARSARSKYTRRRFKELLRRSRFIDNSSPGNERRPHVYTNEIRFGGFAISPNDSEEMEVVVNDKGAPLTTEKLKTSPSQCSPQFRIHQVKLLAFRVWDQYSRTVFSPETGFVSQMHSIWNGELLPAPNPDTEDGNSCHLLLTNLHLNKQGNASAYVSCATSLIQVLGYASNMVDPYIAVINCQHPSVSKPHQQLKASDILRELKSLGQAQWARYRGIAEKLIFGSVPADAIIYHGSLSEIASIVTAEPGGSLLLNPTDFQPDQTVRELAEKLKDRNIVLDDRLARAMGIWAKTMGLGSAAIPSSHMIREFVQVLTDGWTIRFEDDIHTRASLAMTFARALGSETFRFQQVVEEFIAGLEHGLENVTFYSNRRRRSSSRRRRTS